MRLAILCQRYAPQGGAERFLERSLEAVLERDVAITLYTREWPQTNLQLIEPHICDPLYVGALWRDWGSRVRRPRDRHCGHLQWRPLGGTAGGERGAPDGRAWRPAAHAATGYVRGSAAAAWRGPIAIRDAGAWRRAGTRSIEAVAPPDPPRSKCG